MANEQNLKPFTSEQNREEAKKNGKKGGIKSGEVRRERKKFKETMEMLLKINIKDDKTKNTLKAFGIEDNEMNNQTLLMVGLFKAAMNGNVNAYKEIQTMIEQNGNSNENIQRIQIINDLPKEDVDD